MRRRTRLMSALVAGLLCACSSNDGNNGKGDGPVTPGVDGTVSQSDKPSGTTDTVTLALLPGPASLLPTTE